MAAPGQLGRRLQRFKGMERGFKNAVIRLLATVLPAPAPRTAPDWDTRPHRVLYLRYDRIGDMILATGIIEAIVQAHPSVTVDVLASPANASVLEGNPHVGQVVLFEKQRPWTYLRTLRTIRRTRYDAVLDAMVLSPSLTTSILMLLSRASHRVGVAGRGSEFALTLPVPRARHAVHYVDHSAALLSAFGIDPHFRAPTVTRNSHASRPEAAPAVRPVDSGAGSPLTTGAVPLANLDAPEGGWGVWRPRLYLTGEELARGEAQWTAPATASVSGEPGHTPVAAHAPSREAPRRLAINVSAGDQTRYWPEDRFVSAITWIRERFPDLSLLIIGSPHDRARMEQIGQAGGVRLAATPGMRDMMAVVAKSDIVFTADTSVTHVASAYDKPAVVMFPRGRGALYGPYGTAGRVVSTPAPTLQSLAVPPVLAVLDDVITAESRSTVSREQNGQVRATTGMEG
jgi:ADP-heptose:LPS heptosyltransferase